MLQFWESPMLQFWESTQEYNVLVLLVLSPRHLPMATSGVLPMVQAQVCSSTVGFTLTATVSEKTGSIPGA